MPFHEKVKMLSMSTMLIEIGWASNKIFLKKNRLADCMKIRAKQSTKLVIFLNFCSI